MKKIDLLLFLAIFILAVLTFFLIGYKLFIDHSNQNLKIIKINDTQLIVEIADTVEERAKGLSNRNYLMKNRGMLFVFDKPDCYSFWMKDMLIPLDFIWIKDGIVVEVSQDVKPEDYQPPRALTSRDKIDMVLEINAGLVKEFNFKVGDKANLIYD